MLFTKFSLSSNSRVAAALQSGETSYDNLERKREEANQLDNIRSYWRENCFGQRGKRLFTEKICIRWQKFALFIFFNIFKCFFIFWEFFWLQNANSTQRIDDLASDPRAFLCIIPVSFLYHIQRIHMAKVIVYAFGLSQLSLSGRL